MAYLIYYSSFEQNGGSPVTNSYSNAPRVQKSTPKECPYLELAIEVPEDHLGRHVLRAATKRIREFFILHILLRQSEISNLNMPIVVDQQILGLQVSVHNFLLMQVQQPVQNLDEVKSSILLGHAFDLLQIEEELTSWAIYD